MKNIPIDSRLAGQRNERLILSVLREHGELSQTQVCRLIGLGSSTASSIVSRLRDKGLIIESQGQSDKRGPKPVLLKINPSARYVIGIEINPSYIHLGLFDFVAGLQKKRKIPLSSNHSTDHVLDLIDLNLEYLYTANGGISEKMLGFGVTLSGSVTAQGTVLLSSTLGWNQVPLKELMELRLKSKVSVFSTRVRLMAEIALEPELQSRNILYINIANGVGAAVYMDGKILAGSSGRWGEIGHTIADPLGPVCGCGLKGCLEALISGPSITQRIRQDIAGGTETNLSELIRQSGSDVPEDIITLWGRAIDQKDPYALQLRDYVAKYINHAAASAINSFDPDTIVLAGYVCQQSPEFFAESIRQMMSKLVYDSARRDIRIMAARAGEDALIKGVAMAFLQDVHPI